MTKEERLAYYKTYGGKLFTERKERLESMEGWRNKGYFPSDNSGMTIGYGIDLKMINTVEDLVAHGINKATAEQWEKLGILGKTKKELLKEGKKIGALRLKVNIPNTTLQKNDMAIMAFKGIDETLKQYEGKISDDLYISLSSQLHFNGSKGKISPDGFESGPFERKSHATALVWQEIDNWIAENPDKPVPDKLIHRVYQDNATNLKASGSPMNATTYDRDAKKLYNDSIASQNYHLDRDTEGAVDVPEGDSTISEQETQALLKNLKIATDESSGKRDYTVRDVDLEVVNSAEKNIRNYYIDKYSDERLDDDDIMMGENDFKDEESIFSRISSELSSDLDMQTEKGQAIFKARLEAYQEKVTSPEYVDNLRSTYQGPGLRSPLTKDMAYTNIVQDSNFKLKLLGQTVNSANEQYDVVIETRDFIALGGEERGFEENLGKITGTNQDAITTAQIIAKRLAKEGNKVLADLLMEEGGSEKAGQIVLDEIAKQSLNKDEQGSDLDYELLTKNLERRITDPEGYAEETGQTNINQNSSDLINTSFNVSPEDQAKLDAEATYIKKVEEGTATQEERDAAVVGHEDRLAKALTTQKEKEDAEKATAAAADKEALKGERRDKRMRTAEKVLTGLKAAAGLVSLSKALRDPEVETPELSPLIIEAVDKQRQLAKSGFSSAEKASAMNNLNDAYAGAMKNVLRASGGQRGLFLANQGTVDANRISGLNQLAAEDAKLHRQNIQQYNQLASSVGQMALSRDMSVEQMRQATMNNNRQTLSGIGSNLVSEALSDVSWYMNPNRDLIEQATRTNLEGIANQGKDNTEDPKTYDYTVGGASFTGTAKDEIAARKQEAARLKALNK